MEIIESNSVLSTNNSFYKVFKSIKDKRSKNESDRKETQWIESKLLSENPKICANAVQVLVALCDRDHESEDRRVALSTLITTLPRIPAANFELIADGIFELLLVDTQYEDYQCPGRSHKALLLLDDSPDKMLYMSRKMIHILKQGPNSGISYSLTEFTRPILLTMFCSDKIYPELIEIWRVLVNSRTGIHDYKKRLAIEILSMRRALSASASYLFNSMIVTDLEMKVASNYNSYNMEPVNTLLLLIVSTSRLVALSLDPTENLEILLERISCLEAKNLVSENDWRHSSNIVLFLLAELLQSTSIFHMPKLLPVLELLIVHYQLGHPIILQMVLDGLVQVTAYSSFLEGKLDSIPRLMNAIKTHEPRFPVDTSTFNAEYLKMSPDLLNARYVSIMLEKNKALKISKITTQGQKFFWTRNQLVLRGFFHSDTSDIESWNCALENLILISKNKDELKSSLVTPLLFKLSTTTNPQMKLAILQNITALGATTEVFSTIKALSSGLIRSLSIDLHLRLWRVEPRTYPFLYKVLVEKSKQDVEDIGLDVVRANAIREICDLRPQHGPDLVSAISEILNTGLESVEGEVQAALAIEAIVLLCQNHITNVVSTWKEIDLKTRYEKRPRIVKSLCEFFAIIPSLKRNTLDYENLEKEILAKLWHMIQWSDKHGITSAVQALKSWNYDLMKFDTIPEAYREGIELPKAPAGMEVSILDLEVPGECFVQLLCKVNPDGREAVAGLLKHYIGCEIEEFRSGHYTVKEGQAEPVNYKTLPKQSILKALTHFVINQATTKKSDKLVEEEVLVFALQILGYRYSRPLPPLNWCFLHDLLFKSEDLKAESLIIAAKQSSISGTAKRLIENVLVNLQDNSDDVGTVLESLVEICNGVSTEVMKIFSEYIFKGKEISSKDCLKKCLADEKLICNRENLSTLLSAYLSYGNVSLDVMRLVPPAILDSVSSQLTEHQKIEFRCEILKTNPNVNNPIGWMSELITELLPQDDDHMFFIESLIKLLIASDTFPKTKWLSDFIIITQNRLVTMNIDSPRVKPNIDFLFDILLVSVIISSGYYKAVSENEIFEKRLQMFPESVELVSHQVAFEEVSGRIFEFMLHFLEDERFIYNENLYVTIRDAFRGAIIVSKDVAYFKKPRVWQKFIMLPSKPAM